jgi:hypothetical protein
LPSTFGRVKIECVFPVPGSPYSKALMYVDWASDVKILFKGLSSG